MTKIQAVRGMNDVLPDQTPIWRYLEQVIRSLLAAYAYREIRFPVVESTQLFKRSIGEVTDIVEKEMYTFEDRNGDSLSLRPEGTAGCVRAAEQHGLLYNQTQRLWYLGPMYRHERPQKGRYRQFHQFGVEAFGMAGADIEAELILLCADLWRRLGIDAVLRLEMNNLGTSECRARYGRALKQYLAAYRDDLDPDSRRRLKGNVLRILDSKDPGTREILVHAPRLSDYLDDASRQAFDRLLALLDAAGIQPALNLSLVRGLDYYNSMVFEWTTERLGAQATVCAGGRYDGLSRQLGGSDTPAVGFAAGLERLILLLQETGQVPPETARQVDVYIAVIGEGVQSQAMLLARRLRRDNPRWRVLTHCGGGKYNSQLKKAYQSGARCALVFEGEAELNEIKGKVLDDKGESVTLNPAKAQEWLRGIING